LFTDAVRGEMHQTKKAADQSMMNLISTLKRTGTSATVASNTGGQDQSTALKAGANPVTTKEWI